MPADIFVTAKFEIRNSKSEKYLNPKFKCSKLLDLDHLIFEFVSHFRYSNFEFIL